MFEKFKSVKTYASMKLKAGETTSAIEAALHNQDIIEGIVQFHAAMKSIKEEDKKTAESYAIDLGVSEDFFNLLEVKDKDIRALITISKEILDNAVRNISTTKTGNENGLLFNDTDVSRGKRIAIISAFSSAIYDNFQSSKINVSKVFLASKIEGNNASEQFVLELKRAFSQRLESPEVYSDDGKNKGDPLNGHKDFYQIKDQKIKDKNGNKQDVKVLSFQISAEDLIALNASAFAKIQKYLNEKRIDKKTGERLPAIADAIRGEIQASKNQIEVMSNSAKKIIK